MNEACHEFRTRLVQVLSGVPRLEELAWHEHLLGCAECRELLEAEEALEALLTTLPEPQLPPALAGRVLARLSAARDPLDSLLELDATGDAPADLAGDVLAALRPHRARGRDEAALDRLLERVPATAVPAGLADRVLDGLEVHRSRPRPRLVRGPVLALVGALAAAVLAAILFGTLRGDEPDPSDEAVAAVEPRPGEVETPPKAPDESGESGEPTATERDPAPEPVPDPDPAAQIAAQGPTSEPPEPLTPQDPGDATEWPPDELLASLELLESWDLLNNDDLDLALASLDAVDEVLLDFEAGGI
jgi:hypothetical protein